MTKGKRKEPKAAEDPRPAGRIPRQGDDPEKSLGEKIAWGLGRSDFSGPWGVEGLSKTKWWGELFPKLRNFESMTWAEIMRASGGRKNGTNSHFVQLDALEPKARKRLGEIKQDDVDQLFSLRLTGTERIIGIKEGRVLQIIWYDPNHDVVSAKRR